MACVQPDDYDFSESDLNDIEDEYSLDISKSDSFEFKISSETDSNLGI